MGREGVTFEEVAEAAQALLDAGERPTWRSVRARLGDTGSANTILRHVRAWLAARPQPSTARPLPEALARVFSDELSRAVAEARVDLEVRLEEASSDAANFAAAGEALQVEVEALRLQVRALSSELDTERGRTAHQAAALERAERELAREREAAESGRMKAAEAVTQLAAVRSATSERDSQIHALRDEAKATQAELGGVERELAGAQATISALTTRCQELQATQQALTRELAVLRERLDQSAVRERDLAAEVARRDVAAHAAEKSADEWRAMAEAGTARERDLAAQLARTETALEAARAQQHDALERARLEWRLEARATESASGTVEPRRKR